MNDLFARYKEEMIPVLMKEFELKNAMQVPRLVKVVVNCGMGEALTDKKVVEKMAQQLSLITGQKVQVTHAKKAIATFKLREGDAIGLKVTLRKAKMYDFLRKLVSIALPRVRDFRGISVTAFDGKGNYTLGIPEQTIFPEIDFTMVDKVRGFEVTFVTTGKTNDQVKRLLELMGLPFEKEGNK